jgi:hypothetical protein
MDQAAEGGAAASQRGSLEAGIEALSNAAGWLAQAGRQIEAVSEDSDAVVLLGEEVRDVLTRVKAHREKLASTLPPA